MSFAEFSIVILLAILLIKPKDLPFIVKKLKETFLYLSSLKKEVMKELDILSSESPKKEHYEEINLYLKKIMELDATYTGEYKISDIKAFYHKLLLQKRIK